MEMFSSMATFFRSGGPFMFVIMGTAVLIVAISLERLWVMVYCNCMRFYQAQCRYCQDA